MDQTLSWSVETPGLESSYSLCQTVPLPSTSSQSFISSDTSLDMAPDIDKNTLVPTVLNLALYGTSPRGSPDEHLSSEILSFQSNNALTGPLQRRSHDKSRRGCYNCKRRRVKVDLKQLDKV
jgi:hypothetical protein